MSGPSINEILLRIRSALWIAQEEANQFPDLHSLAQEIYRTRISLDTEINKRKKP